MQGYAQAESVGNHQGDYPKSARAMMAGAQVGRGPAPTAIGLEVLAKELAGLEETATALIQRLLPVLSPRPESTAGYLKDASVGGSSPFAEKLRVCHANVERIRRLLQETTDALEV